MTESTLEVLFLLVLKLNFGLSAYIGTDVDRESLEVLQNEREHSRFTALEVRCFSQEQVPYGNNCYPLLTQGPCHAGEWLILDMESATLEEPQLVPVCVEKQCNNNDIFWPRDGYCYNMTEGDSVLCPQRGTYLHVDPFGEGICDCKRDAPYVRWFTSDEHLSFRCYEAYTKGPCSEGFIVVKKGPRVFCEEDPCVDFQKRGVRYAFWDEDGTCYALESRGPCPKDKKFIIHQDSKVPVCGRSISNPLHLIDLPTVCKTDHAGECVDEVQILSTTDKFTNQLIQMANEKKRKTASSL